MGELDILCQGTECCIRGFIELRQKLLCILWMDALFYTGYKLCRRNLYFFCYLEYRVLYSSPCRLFLDNGAVLFVCSFFLHAEIDAGKEPY